MHCFPVSCVWKKAGGRSRHSKSRCRSTGCRSCCSALQRRCQHRWLSHHDEHEKHAARPVARQSCPNGVSQQLGRSVHRHTRFRRACAASRPGRTSRPPSLCRLPTQSTAQALSSASICSHRCILVHVWQHGVGATGCNHAARVCQGQGHPLDCVHADAHGPGSYR